MAGCFRPGGTPQSGRKRNSLIHPAIFNMASNTEASRFSTLRERLRGTLLLSGDDTFDAARALWNGRFTPRPRAIARCRGTADVMLAVDFAREHHVPLSVKSTGHSYAGTSVRDDGLLIDLSLMNAVRVDPSAMRAHVAPGARWGDFDHEAQAFGLATTGATVSTVGVSGYTLGGGTGYLARKHGLGLDNLISADVVTANGHRVHASEQENAELFWGLRGGGAHLGVVTSFEFALHEVGPHVLAGQIVHDFTHAADLLRFWRAYMKEAPDELQCYAFIVHIPPIDAFPPETHGEVGVDFVVSYAGPAEEGNRVLQPLRAFGDPILDTVAPQPYAAVQKTFDAGTPPGLRWYSRAHLFDEISDEAIDTIVHFCDALPGPFSMVYFEPLGGAIGKVDASATAYPHRDAAFGFHVFPGWSNPEEDHEITEWARAFSGALAPHASGGVYVNLLSDDEPDRLSEAYGANFERLVGLKKRYDPDDMFSAIHTVPNG